jgi:hypothetical protein
MAMLLSNETHLGRQAIHDSLSVCICAASPASKSIPQRCYCSRQMLYRSCRISVASREQLASHTHAHAHEQLNQVRTFHCRKLGSYTMHVTMTRWAVQPHFSLIQSSSNDGKTSGV